MTGNRRAHVFLYVSIGRRVFSPPGATSRRADATPRPASIAPRTFSFGALIRRLCVSDVHVSVSSAVSAGLSRAPKKESGYFCLATFADSNASAGAQRSAPRARPRAAWRSRGHVRGSRCSRELQRSRRRGSAERRAGGSVLAGPSAVPAVPDHDGGAGPREYRARGRGRRRRARARAVAPRRSFPRRRTPPRAPDRDRAAARAPARPRGAVGFPRPRRGLRGARAGFANRRPAPDPPRFKRRRIFPAARRRRGSRSARPRNRAWRRKKNDRDLF